MEDEGRFAFRAGELLSKDVEDDGEDEQANCIGSIPENKLFDHVQSLQMRI